MHTHICTHTERSLTSWPIVKLEPRSHIPPIDHSPSPPSNGDPMEFTPPTLHNLAKNNNEWEELHISQRSLDNDDTTVQGQSSPDIFGGQSSPNTGGDQSSSSAWGPVVSEEADFDRAIELSLKEMTKEEEERSDMEIFGLNVNDLNQQEDNEGAELPIPSLLENLPTELRHLLDNSNRSGARV